MNLEEIAQKEEFILFDTSINSLGEFPEKVYQYNYYYQINTTDILNAQDELLYFIDFVSRKNIFTIKEVFQELSKLENILSKKGKNLNEMKKAFKKTIEKEDTNQEKEYNILLGMMHNAMSLVKGKIKKPRDIAQYNVLYNSILDVKKTFFEYIQEEDNNLNTDEKIAALLLHSSIIESKPYTLVSNDSGIFWLTNKFYRLVCVDDSKDCKYLKDDLIKNPVKIYVHSENLKGYELRFFSKKEPSNLEKEKEEIKKLNFKVLKF